MPITDSDLFLIEDTSGVSKKITASKLKANLASGTYDNYKLLVNKPDYSSRFVYAQNMQGSVAPTDYMMVERADVSYKVTGQQLIDYFPSTPADTAGPITDLGATTNYASAVTGSPDSSYPPSNAFNGNVSGSYEDGAKPATGTSLVWDTSLLDVVPTGSVLKLHVYVGMGYAGGQQLVINGQEYVFPGTSDREKVVEHDLTVNNDPGPLNTVKWTYTSPSTNYCYLKGIEIDGKLLIDNNFEQLTLASTTNLDLFTAGDAINMVDDNGDVASYTPVTSTITNVSSNTLTFTSPNPDLKYFNPGDSVGNVGGYIVSPDEENKYPNVDFISRSTNATTSSIFNTAFDGSLTTAFYALNLNWDVTVNLTTLITYTNPTIEIRHATLNEIDVLFTDGSIFTCTTPGSATKPYEYTLPAGKTIRAFRLYTKADETNTTLSYIKIDGVALQLNVSPRVVSTDTNANTMLVDGGSWTGSDGTSSGDAAYRETKVTGPAKSGTGNFVSATGPVVDVSNSNQQWIDNTNRLGESFYIKSASTRTGLAVLRTKAIAQSQAWAADAGYLAEQLVRHNGRYWFALSSNYANNPDETDTLDWFDLGAIEPVAVNGYYPLYSTSAEAESVSPSNSYHTHTFDGVTYYMPDGGTIYHGNYSG